MTVLFQSVRVLAAGSAFKDCKSGIKACNSILKLIFVQKKSHSLLETEFISRMNSKLFTFKSTVFLLINAPGAMQNIGRESVVDILNEYLWSKGLIPPPAL